MDAFSVRDLRERTGKLIRDAEAGKLSVVTKRGRPVFVAVPMDERLVRDGVGVAFAVRLYRDEVLSLGKAARLAGLSIPEFLDRLGELGIPAVRYSPKELDKELAVLSRDRRRRGTSHRARAH
jgi:prevent-host-death family protein